MGLVLIALQLCSSKLTTKVNAMSAMSAMSAIICICLLCTLFSSFIVSVEVYFIVHPPVAHILSMSFDDLH